MKHKFNVLVTFTEEKTESQIKEKQKELVKVLGSNDYSFYKVDEYLDYSSLMLMKENLFTIIVPFESNLSENYLEMITDYIKEDRVVLPLVVLQTEKIKGILNSCIWNMSLTPTPGELDLDLSLKQIDLSLYGAVIPTKYILDESNYNKELKYYQHFYFLNKLCNKEVEIVGVPKTLISTEIDLSYTGVSNEDKVKNFNLAKELKKD